MSGRVAGSLAAAAWLVAVGAVAAPPPPPVADEITVDATWPLNTIVPERALGAALDGMVEGQVKQVLTPFNIGKMRSAGLRRLTYRTRPELGIEAWHWSEEGTWSDPAHSQGYWTGSDNPSGAPDVTWGYSLPRRGDSVDQANDKGYSRIDDGDPVSFWKSNPYLDGSYTGATENRSQWIVVSFDKPAPIDGAQIAWGTPFARHFLVQYWNGDDEYDDDGRWTTFPHGDQTIPGAPTDAVLRLAEKPIRARYVRILLLRSSHTAPTSSTDVRDSLGYAVRELSLGLQAADGGLRDAMGHAKTRDGQTLIQVSSTDPWHRASDRDLGTEQPSLDLVFRTGLAGGLPSMVPVGVFYDTPENAAAELRYIRRRGWPVSQVELGEEPDGQSISPEDYADLYLETAKALRAVDPTVVLGGPSLQDAITDTWPDPEAGGSWSGRFVARLRARGGLDQLQFFSFEHYAFDEVCAPLGGMLRDETDLMNQAMADAAANGVPKTIPWVISEYGLSPFSGRAMAEVPNALFAADVVGHFLSLGGDTAFMFGYPPDTPANQTFPCAGYGNMMLFQADDGGPARWPMPVYYAQQMMMNDWGAPANQPHQLFAATSRQRDPKGRPFVVAYPLRAPDGRWSVMLVNRDEARAHIVTLRFHGGEPLFGAGETFSAVQYSPAQYQWLDKGAASHPVLDLPPRRFALPGGKPVVLPAFSLTVLSGARPAAP